MLQDHAEVRVLKNIIKCTLLHWHGNTLAKCLTWNVLKMDCLVEGLLDGSRLEDTIDLFVLK